jgi:hypothetical protein
LLFDQFDGQVDGSGEDVVERTIDGLFDFFLAAAVRNLADSNVRRNTGCEVFAETASSRGFY